MQELIDYPDNVRFRVHGALYIPFPIRPSLNSIVIDRLNGTHGKIDYIAKGVVSVQDKWVNELMSIKDAQKRLIVLKRLKWKLIHKK